MKAIIRVNYINYVLDVHDAVKVAEALSALNGAEVYDTKWHGPDSQTTRHVFELEEKESQHIEVTLISDSQYQMYKLAGKPESK